ncbi:MAG: GDSL-type esterase/lipase family protein, partial [Verrucomicrobiota bacterium]
MNRSRFFLLLLLLTFLGGPLFSQEDPHNEFSFITIDSPAKGSTLSGGTVTFTWSGTPPSPPFVSHYEVSIGAPFYPGDTTVPVYTFARTYTNSITLSGIPTDGRPLALTITAWASETYGVPNGQQGALYTAANIPPVSNATPKPIGNLWCIGDSWTDCWDGTTWRRKLSQDLNAREYQVDFVGTQVSSSSCEPGQVFDRDHDGYLGITAGEFLTGIDVRLSRFAPDTVLMMLGRNDIQETDIYTVASRIESIIDRIRLKNPNVVIHMGMYGYVNVAVTDQELDAYAIEYRNLAIRENTSQSPIHFVDHRSGWNKGIHLDTDDYHPSPSGMAKIAQNWLGSIERNHTRGGGGGGGGVTPPPPNPLKAVYEKQIEKLKKKAKAAKATKIDRIERAAFFRLFIVNPIISARNNRSNL